MKIDNGEDERWYHQAWVVPLACISGTTLFLSSCYICLSCMGCKGKQVYCCIGGLTALNRREEGERERRGERNSNRKGVEAERGIEEGEDMELVVRKKRTQGDPLSHTRIPRAPPLYPSLDA